MTWGATRQTPRVSAIIPTRNRCDVLEATLTQLCGSISPGVEVIVVDNGSTDGAVRRLQPGFPAVRWIELNANQSAASRNIGAVAAHGDVLLMLDDDSVPAPDVFDRIGAAFLEDPRLGAIACRIRLAHQPDRHDDGGLAGVIVSCGAAIRREAFLAVGGYPVDFDYYAEEYDLCCRLWSSGWRIEPRGDFTVFHARSSLNRDMDHMLRLLTRNNLKVWDRYAPADQRSRLIDETIERYRHLAVRENARRGFDEGLAAWQSAAPAKPRRPLSLARLEQLFGIPMARQRLAERKLRLGLRRVAIAGRGKGCPQLLDLLDELDIDVTAVYEQGNTEATWRGLVVREPSQLAGDRIDAMIPGTLSLGVAENQQGDLSRQFSDLPVIAAVSWSTTEQESATNSLSAPGPRAPRMPVTVS